MFRRTVRRAVTSYGQYNPVHQFNFDPVTGQPANLGVAKDQAEFKRMITNPGPLRVEYSDDYLDWYYRAYTERVRFQQQQQQIQARFKHGAPSASVHPAAAKGASTAVPQSN